MISITASPTTIRHYKFPQYYKSFPHTIIVQTSTMSASNQQLQQKRRQTDNLLFKKLEDILMVIKKDSSLWASEVLKVINYWKIEFAKVTEATQHKNERFCQFTIFLCKCSIYYSGDMSFIPNALKDLLTNYGDILNPSTRRKAAAGLIILRSKNQLDAATTIKYLMGLMNIQDKQLRKMIYSFIINDLKRINKEHKNNKVNKELQNHFLQHIRKNSDKVAKKMINMTIDLYKRNVWNQNKVVNIVADGCFNASAKIRLISSYFLISTTEAVPEESDEEDEVDPKDIRLKKGIAKTTRFKQKLIQKQKKRAIKKIKRKAKRLQNKNFFPIDCIYNPQDFCEKLFKVMKQKDQKFIVKIVMMSLMARMIGRHQLIVLPFYSFLQVYMYPYQKDIGKILTYFAESVHELVPSEQLQPIIKHIIEGFVNDRCSEMAMTMGINVIREISIKNHEILNEDMVRYISTYYQYKNKNVSTAAKGFINAVRDINFELLERKHRGRNFMEGMVLEPRRKLATGIDGAELLGEDGKVPVYMDRILTDEDFKRIRKLKRRRDEELEQEREEEMVEEDKIGEEGEGYEVNEEDPEWLSDSDQQEGDEQAKGEEQWEEGQEELDEDGEYNEDQNEEEEDEDLEFGSEQQQLDWDNVEQLPLAQNQTLKNNKKRRVDAKKLREQLSSQSEQQQEDANPHDFISQNMITFYKKSKTEVKAQKRRGDDKEGKEKFVHKPKEKKGGTNDRQKQRHKPLMMLRNKKNKLKLREKQIKVKIKDLKNKLGKVRSGKEAKKLRNTKVKM